VRNDRGRAEGIAELWCGCTTAQLRGTAPPDSDQVAHVKGQPQRARPRVREGAGPLRSCRTIEPMNLGRRQRIPDARRGVNGSRWVLRYREFD
jgi:hypothetical protein